MSLDPAESTLTTGDYHRLGVRESEARARIIRHAAHQLAEPLVRRHLEAPDIQTESDLVEVVTSTYRLLDPRRRATAVERALLTQPEPVRAVEPRWAHPKAVVRQKGTAADGTRFNAVSFQSIPANSSALFPEPNRSPINGSPLRVALRRLASGNEPLRRYRPPSWLYKGYLWVAPAAFVLLLIAIRPILIGPREAGGTDDAATEASSSVELSPGKAPSLQSVPSDRGQPEASPAGNRPDAPLHSTPPSDSAAEVPSPPSEMIADDEALDRNEPTSDKPATAPAKAERGGSASGLTIGPPEETPSKEMPPEETPPEETPTEETPTEETPTKAGQPDVSGDTQEGVSAQQQVRLPPAAATPRQAPLPSPAELKQSRSRLQKLLADRPKPDTEAQQMREVEWLLDLRKDSPPASADALAIAQFVVAKLVAAGRYRQAAAIIDELEGQFDAEDSQLGCSTTEQLVESAGSLADHRRIVAWCLVLSERYLQAELFDGATEMTRLGTICAVKLGDGELRSRLSQHRDAISTARRTSESVWKITGGSSPASATATDAAQAGRYLCLMIRDWEQGVPWLANSSDSRLAAAAQQELLLNKPPDDRGPAENDQPAVDGGTVARAWLDASDRFRGRLGESAKLHAYELISQATEKSAGLRTLELQKQLDALREQLPEDLLPSQAETAPAANRLAGGGQQAMPAEAGVMEGRLILGGRDTGTLIRYSPGVQLRQNVIDQIFQALQKPAAPWTLRFEGMLHLEKAATIRFIAVGPTAPEGDTVLRVNSNRLTLAESVRGRSAAVDLAAGMHRVTWQISGSNLDEAFVLLQDEISGDRLGLTAPPADRNPLPTRFRINIQRAP